MELTADFRGELSLSFGRHSGTEEGGKANAGKRASTVVRTGCFHKN
ncbi:MAG: hypothetical protein ACOYEQ_06645 [Bacillota bacterium]